MKLPLSWLKEFIEVPWPADELADRLSNVGIGIESKDEDVFELEISPNRGDLLSVLGIAREIRALTTDPINEPPRAMLPAGSTKFAPTIDDPLLVPRYAAAIVEGLNVKPTKNTAIIHRLKLAGMRPINNVVDITNYVMLELGQPSHAFDLAKINGGVMHIRQAREGERLTTLDGVNRELPEGALIIEDKDRIIDLAGIMGGQNSEIDEKTTQILLQAAVFDPVIIRRGSKRLNLSTEASYRYERGVDEGGTLEALKRLIALLLDAAGGKVTGVVDIDKTVSRRPMTFDLEVMQRVVGDSYAAGEVRGILERMGCAVDEQNNELLVTPPTWRHDLTISEDLVEEVTRVKGYKAINPQPLPVKTGSDSEGWEARESLKDWFAKKGLSEVMTYSLISPRDLTAAGTAPENVVHIGNPLSEELQFFRPSLLPGLLKTAAKNPTVDPIQIFEIGHVAMKDKEWWQVGFLFAGKGAHEIKRVADHLGIAADRVPTDTLARYKIRKKEVFIALADWSEITHRVERTKLLKMAERFTIRPLSKYPPVTRDISMIIPGDIRNDEIKMAIAGVSEYIHLVELFDEYQDAKMGQGKKSLAFHITYQDPDKTMTGKAVSPLHKSVEKELIDKFHATIR